MGILLKSRIHILMDQLIRAHMAAKPTEELDLKLGEYVGFGSPMVKAHSTLTGGLGEFYRLTIRISADGSQGGTYLTRHIAIQDGVAERKDNALSGLRMFRDLVKHAIGTGQMNRLQWVYETPHMGNRIAHLSILSPLIEEALRVMGPQLEGVGYDFTGPRLTRRISTVSPDEVRDHNRLVRETLVAAGQNWTIYSNGLQSCGARSHTTRWRDQILDRHRRLSFTTFCSNANRITEALKTLPNYPFRTVFSDWSLVDCRPSL